MNKYYMFDKLNEYDNILHLYSKKPINYNKNQKSSNELNDIILDIEKDFSYTFKVVKGTTQTHSNNVGVIDNDSLNKDFNNYDGLITNLEGVALIMKTADCQSIFLYDPINKVIGNIHSGWKGTLNKIAINAISIMKEKFNSNYKDIIVCISPSIRSCCFEVDEDVYSMFKNKFCYINEFVEKKNNKYYIDTINLNKKILKEIGIKEENIFDSGICTKCNSKIYHSYREDKDNSGRNLSLIVLK